jgi:mono/diheme cytochrome c family protein
VNILSFCTTQDCVDRNNNHPDDQSEWRYPVNPFRGTGTVAAAVPFSAATDGRDHWLSPGEPHCADCHAAPFTEQSGNINPFPPFNYPAKASLMRYSRGHQDLGCQACHESIHGLYPVSAAIDTTSYAQAAALNHDGSHGPLKCGTCHEVGPDGIPTWIRSSGVVGSEIGGSFDAAVTWAHRYTDEANVLDSTCQNCHGANGFGPPDDEWPDVSASEEGYLVHAMRGRTSRLMMDKAEIALYGDVLGTGGAAELSQLCSTCHKNGKDKLDKVNCGVPWRQHLTQGRVAEVVWEDLSLAKTGGTCGW